MRETILLRLGGLFITSDRFLGAFKDCYPEIFSACKACAQGSSFQFRDRGRSQFRFLFRAKDGCENLISFRTSAITGRFNLLASARGFINGANFNCCISHYVVWIFTCGTKLDRQ